MKREGNNKRRAVFAMGLAAVLAAPVAADAAGFRFQAGSRRQNRVWIPPVYDTRTEQVWIEPVYEVRHRKVWMPPVYERRWIERTVPAVIQTRRVPQYNRRGRVVGYRMVKEMVRPARTIRERVQVKVREGRYRTLEERVLVSPGHTRTIHKKVLVREGHYRTRRGPGGGRDTGFSFAFNF